MGFLSPDASNLWPRFLLMNFVDERLCHSFRGWTACIPSSFSPVLADPSRWNKLSCRLCCHKASFPQWTTSPNPRAQMHPSSLRWLLLGTLSQQREERVTNIEHADRRPRPRRVPPGVAGLCSVVYNAFIASCGPKVKLECCLLCPR